ncbi:MAG: hypothetical protein ACPL88_08635, partial [Bryobacteraceae bacterium]
PQAAGVFGFLGRSKAAAGAIEVQLGPSARGFAAILVTALDDRPIQNSRRLLVTAPGYTLGTQPRTDPPRMQRLIAYPATTGWFTIEPEPGSTRPSGPRSAGIEPIWMERVESFVTLKTSGRQITVCPLDNAGGRLEALPAASVEPVAGGYRIHLQAEGQPPAPWYEILVQ